MAAKFSIPVPRDFILARDVCSYGYFLLAPSHWDPSTASYLTTLDTGGRAVTVRITQGEATAPTGVRELARRRGIPLAVKADVALGKAEQAVVAGLLGRMFRVDEDHTVLSGYHKVDPRWKKSGRGRLMRSGTLFEDVIKTVTSCNVTWPSTIIMNRRMCEIVGRKSASGLFAFPTAARLARTRPQKLRARCSVGYRDQRIIELAKMFAKDVGPALPRKLAAKGIAWPTGKQGGFAAWLESPQTTDEHVFAALMELPGVGPYAAANIMQLLGRYARLPLDTESIRHAKSILKFTGTDRELMKKLHAHYEPFGEHRFRSYWFELWEFYEAKRGPAWTWERETTGKTFTAALLAD